MAKKIKNYPPELRSESSSGNNGSRQDLDLRTPTHEEIALRAYHLYEQKGGADGCELDNWLEAEAQLLTARRTEDLHETAAA